MATGAYGTIMYLTPLSGSRVTVGELASIGEITASYDEIDVTTLDAFDGYKKYMPGYKDSGTLSVEGFFSMRDAGQAAMRAAYDSGEMVSVEIVFHDGSTAAFTTYVKSFSAGGAKVDGAVRFSAVLRILGKIRYTAAQDDGGTSHV